jgi:hypothetical protein
LTEKKRYYTSNYGYSNYIDYLAVKLIHFYLVKIMRNIIYQTLLNGGGTNINKYETLNLRVD